MNYEISVLSLSGRKHVAVVDGEKLAAAIEAMQASKSKTFIISDVYNNFIYLDTVDCVVGYPVVKQITNESEEELTEEPNDENSVG